LQFLVALDYADAFATAGGGRLENEVFGFTHCLFAHLLVLGVLFGQDPRVGFDVELARVFQLHAKHVFPKHVLPPQIYGVWEVVDLLVLVQSQYILDGRIPCPYQIEVLSSLQLLKPSIFHGVDDCVVDVGAIRIQERHEQVFNLSSSIVLFYVFAVFFWMNLADVARIREESSRWPALVQRLHEFDIVDGGLEHAVGQAALFSF